MISGANDPYCSRPDYDPEWWVHEHPGRCTKDCSHGLAAHICRDHCPLQQACQEMAAQDPKRWQGMVVGGMMWSANQFRRKVSQPPLKTRCSACEPALV